MLDGFDLGLGTLAPFLARTDADKRVVYNSMGPFWDGNEVWLITAGGVTFAAFPTTYAVMFSALYTPLLLLLFALILRAVALEFRSKVENEGWRKLWDVCHFVGSFVPALLLGVAFANIFKGIPIDAEGDFHGNLLTLLNPYGLLGGVLFVLLFLVHGALWLAIKAEAPLEERAGKAAAGIWWVLLVVAVVFLGATWFATSLYKNYLANPVLLLIPLITVLALLAVRFLIQQKGLVESMVCVQLNHCGSHTVRRGRVVSQSFPVQSGCQIQPDDLQLGLQPSHTEDHARCGLNLCAHCDHLPDLGLLRVQAQGDGGRFGLRGSLLTQGH